MAQEESGVRVEIKDYIAVVTFDRPPVNATSRPMVLATQQAFDSFNNNPDVRVAILTGHGKAFCAGADIKARSSSLESGAALQPGAQSAHSRAGREGFNCILDCDVPVIAALNGPAIGAGLAFLTSCDYIIAAETAFVALGEINVGLMGGGRHAQRLFGTYTARRMMYTGDRISAQEMYRRGLVEKVVPADKLMEEAMAMAATVAEKSPIAIKLAKRAMNTVEDMTLKDGYRFEQQLTADLSHTEDAKEAAAAFVQKRKANFKGR
jgi:enoyl-CoA hydratase/carnithine racemase